MKTTPCIILLTAALAAFGTGSAHALLVSDFESGNGYTAGDFLAGQAGWTGAAAGGRVTPDSGHSGYTFKILGDQSTFGSGFSASSPRLMFSTVGATASDMYELSWLQAMPDATTATSRGGIYLINSSDQTPVGLLVGGTNAEIFLVGSGGETGTGVTITTGGGGAPTLNNVYRFTMQFNFTTYNMTGFYEDITNSGSKTSLGSVAFSSAVLPSAAVAASDFGVIISGAGSTSAIDQIVLTPIPEPMVLGLLGTGIGGLLLRRCRNLRRS